MADLANSTRRVLLKFLPGAAAAVSIPVADVFAAPKMSARERVDFLFAELKIAIEEANPNVRVCDILNYLDDPDSPLPLMFIVQWATGKYEGDGIYCHGNGLDRTSRYQVTMLDHPIKGERGFLVIPVGKQDSMEMRLTESRLESFIGQKISEGAVCWTVITLQYPISSRLRKRRLFKVSTCLGCRASSGKRSMKRSPWLLAVSKALKTSRGACRTTAI